MVILQQKCWLDKYTVGTTIKFDKDIQACFKSNI